MLEESLKGHSLRLGLCFAFHTRCLGKEREA